MTLANVPFTKADLASHVLWMCLLMWQYQFNLHKKGTMSVDMRSLHKSLGAIEHICTQEKSNAHSGKKKSGKSETGNKRPGTWSMARVPKKVRFEKHCNVGKKHEDAHTMHNKKYLCKYEKE